MTKVRCTSAISGVRPGGKPVEGEFLKSYLPDHAHADGLTESAEFFRMDYLDSALVELGRQFDAIVPQLWIASGSIGPPPSQIHNDVWFIAMNSVFAVLFRGEVERVS